MDVCRSEVLLHLIIIILYYNIPINTVILNTQVVRHKKVSLKYKCNIDFHYLCNL